MPTTGYTQNPNGFWFKISDLSGPYAYADDGSMYLLPGAGSGGVSAQIQGNVASGVADSGNPVKVGAVYNSTLPTVTTGQRVDLQTDTRGNLRVILTDGSQNSPALGFPSGDAASLGIASHLRVATAPHIHNGNGTWDRDSKASATSRIASSAATTNATVAKASAGTVYAFEAYNSAATAKVLKFYNKATAPTVGTDTPVRTVVIPPTTRITMYFPRGLYFSTGISYALTGAVADSDTTALAAGDVLGVNIDYS